MTASQVVINIYTCSCPQPSEVVIPPGAVLQPDGTYLLETIFVPTEVPAGGGE